jgi:hypothetical protein
MALPQKRRQTKRPAKVHKEKAAPYPLDTVPTRELFESIEKDLAAVVEQLRKQNEKKK